ncbi:MAG: mechanosensitive ion channel family protein [Chloroflexota bacterium]|nr:mechanosensitive ion channel family protein [Chloroflexota bacterium]
MNEFFKNILIRLREIFDPEIMGTKAADLVANLLVAIIIFAAFYLGWIVVRLALKQFYRRSDLDETAQAFTSTIFKYTILLVGGVNALSAVGIDTAGLVASLGIAGITIGFAARDAFSNLISGILIFMDRPFVIGDLVEVGGNYGRVDQITLRSTRIVTPDGKMLAVPNTEIINTTVSSYTNVPHLRIDISITIGVEEDINQVRQILLKLIQSNPDFMESPLPRVIVTQLNDYNVAIELQAWIEDERSHVEKRSELREKVFNVLNAAGVEMPFETIQLTPLEVRLSDRDS